MNLQHLKYFEVLAKEQHYTRSSKLLNVTQPSLSNAIASLEDELGVTLFEKKGRNVVLTKPGKIFHDYVGRTLELLDTGIETVSKISKGSGYISFAFLPVLGTKYVPRLTKGFIDSNSDKEIEFDFHSSAGVTKEIVEGIKSMRYDIGICSYLPDEPTIEFIPVANQELVVITPLDHPLAQFDEIYLEQTQPYDQIGFSQNSGLRSIIDSVFQKHDCTYNIIYEVTVDQVIAGFVSQGFGIAVIPNMNILESLPLKKIRLKNLRWERYFYLATNKDAYLTPAVINFKEYILAHSDSKETIY
ncbi:LysR family transcriptional regulator [Enterococcus florum]|uniref:LysR family transcriptional regulator n=1 Tax=Enterococcus florum TaxID=2480627 RepID=A0A4P5PAR1_9ENTE|nr:LysR family transcriptional regulator [Enterococcus florum]GCF93514.1 LysR family transcriptional regulator [Enterococcus florum]